MLRLNQNTKPYHEHHVYVLLHVVNEKLNFIALILKLGSNLFLVQIISSTAQLIIVILIQLHLSLFIFFLIPVARTRHMLCLAHAARAQRRPTVAIASHTLHINLNHKLYPLRTTYGAITALTSGDLVRPAAPSQPLSSSSSFLANCKHGAVLRL